MEHIRKIVDAIMEQLDHDQIWCEVAKRLIDEVKGDNSSQTEMPNADSDWVKFGSMIQQCLSDSTDQYDDTLEKAYKDQLNQGFNDLVKNITNPAMPPMPSQTPAVQVEQFIAERCEHGEEYEVTSRELWQAYLAWIPESVKHEAIQYQGVFGKVMNARQDITSRRDHKRDGRMVYQGIRLKGE